jgi:chromosome segregation ATPase
MDRFSGLRKLKTSVFGATKSEADSFNTSRKEIMQYKHTVKVLEETVARFEKDIKSLVDMHEKLLHELPQIEPSPKSQNFAKCLETINSRISRLDMSNLREKIATTSSEIKKLTDLVEKRDVALSEKTHYDKKVQGLTEEKKKQRNDTKHEIAIQTYSHLHEQLERESQIMLESRMQTVHALVQEYVGVYRSLFQEVHDLLTQIRSEPVAKSKKGGSFSAPSAPPLLEETFNYRYM